VTQTRTQRRRRRFLAALGLAGAGLVAGRIAVPRLLRPGPARALPPDLDAFARERFAGIDPVLAWDVHVHAVGGPAGGHGCWVHPDLRSHLHPFLRLQYDSYLAVSGIVGDEDPDRQYVDRLLALHREANPAGRMVVLAFDWVVDPDGTENRERSTFHVPDRYVLDLARRHPEIEACISVHPYREDAAERVRAGAAEGAVAVKWLPNAMAIDPASPRCDRFYEALAETGLPLVSHAGAELAVRSGDDEVGNPLRLRRALEHGARVVIAHAASWGSNTDLDAGGERGPQVPSFDLAVRMLREPRFRGRLFADVSAIASVNRCGAPLRALLLADDLHDRLLYGSDYPICAIRPLTSLWLLRRRGYLTAEEADAIDSVRAANALLGDRLLQRCLAVRDGNGAVHRWPTSVFETAALFARGG
jgi:mannonate dehydratase